MKMSAKRNDNALLRTAIYIRVSNLAKQKPKNFRRANGSGCVCKSFYDRNNEFLMVKESCARILYNNFVSRDFKRLNKAFETEHRFHDTRHTFITKADTLLIIR